MCLVLIACRLADESTATHIAVLSCIGVLYTVESTALELCSYAVDRNPPPISFQAVAAQRFREQQEVERRRHLEELRYRDEDKRSQVEERRRAIESADKERREAMLKKNQEREERIDQKRRQQVGSCC